MEVQEMKRAVKKCYHWAGTGAICQFVIMMAVAMLSSFGVAIYGAVQGWDMDRMQSVMMAPGFLMAVNALSYLIANPTAAVIGLAGAGKLKGSKAIFQKSKLSGSVIFYVAMIGLGLQGLSMLIQSVVAYLLQNDGMGLLSSMDMSFTGNIGSNLVILIYFVIIAPVTEEILYRGMILRNLSVVNTRFAIVASALMFGLMHGNLMQCIIGFLIGLLFAAATIKAQSIWPAIIGHMTINANAMLLNLMTSLLTTEQLGIFTLCWMAALLLAGVVFTIIMRKKNREFFTFAKVAEEQREYTWKLFLKRPAVWIFAIIYLVMIIGGFLV